MMNEFAEKRLGFVMLGDDIHIFAGDKSHHGAVFGRDFMGFKRPRGIPVGPGNFQDMLARRFADAGFVVESQGNGRFGNPRESGDIIYFHQYHS